MAEIDDASLNTLQRGFKLLQTLSTNDKARPLLEQALKAADPSIRTTEERAAEVLAPQLSSLNARIDELAEARKTEAEDRKARDDADARARMDLAFSTLRSDEGLTDEGEEAVKRLMVDRAIADPAAAFALFQKQNPKIEVAQASYEPSHWNYDKSTVDTDVEGLWKNPDSWADQEAGRILTEMRKTPNQG